MKTILITGTSRGIGLAAAKTFLDNGWKVIGTSTKGKSPINNENFAVYKLDLSSEQSISRLAEKIRQGKIKLDAIINNAGENVDWMNRAVDLKKLRRTLEVNLIGPISLTEKLIKSMNSPSKIINISSLAGSLTINYGPYMPSYKISKVGINMYTRSLSARLKDKKIDVYSVDPGWVKTDMGGTGAKREPEEVGSELFDLVNSNKETGLFYKEGKVRSW